MTLHSSWHPGSGPEKGRGLESGDPLTVTVLTSEELGTGEDMEAGQEEPDAIMEFTFSEK